MEEDIKILEEKIKIIESLCTDDCINKSTVIDPLKYALENLITRYKQLEEKNKKFYEGEIFTAKQLKNIEQNQKKYFINKQVVKEKIEEYDKQRIKMEKDDIGVGFTLGKEWSDLKAKIEALQDLLERSREDEFKRFN